MRRSFRQKINKPVVITVIILFLLGLGIFKIFDMYADEDRDYSLNTEMHDLVHELDVYQEQHGIYPKTISEIRKSDELCVHKVYTKCRKVFYNPIENRQDFRLALHSFGSHILWYRKDACDDNRAIPEKKAEEILKKFNSRYFFCLAYPEGTKPDSDLGFPIYRQDKEIFDKPEEWPVL